jgi:hypothetical protein
MRESPGRCKRLIPPLTPTGLKAKLDVEPNIYHTQTVLISGNGSARNLR